MAGIYFYDSVFLLDTYQSPNSKYELVVRMLTPNPFSMTMPGDGGNPTIEVILKNANGKVIGKTRSNSDCSIFKDSLYVRWDIENNQVWYAKGRTIHLQTGKVEC